MDPLQAHLQQSLSDRYHLDRELGRGGMAVVYLAEDLKHRRKVAIKALRPGLLPAMGSERFLREIEIVARLAHPNILPLHDSGEADGVPYYVMPFVEGETLRDRLEREGRLAVEDALGIAAEIADALAHAHSLGLVHRDIKPENVLFQAGHAVVADFGIARAVRQAGGERLTESGLAVGTLAYMSPEQASGVQDVDGRTDIYSLACVLHEMLVGTPPLLSPSFPVLAGEGGASPSERPDEIPPTVQGVLTRALARSPADRFATATQFREALQGSFAPSDATPGVRARLRSRWPIATALAAVTLLAFMPQARRLWHRLAGVAQGADVVRLAVLPFDNLTGDPGQEYLSDGLTEEMTSRLGQLQGLLVIGHGSAARYKHTTESVQEIGNELGAQYVLEGSTRREGDTVRVTGALIRVRDQATVWTDSYQRGMEGILALESDVARSVASSLTLVLLPGERARVAQAPPVNAQAYEDYLRGRERARTFSPRDLDAAQQYFERALREDPEYALAYVGLAFVWAGRQQMGILSAAEAAPRAKAAADRALSLDSTLAEAHYQLAILRSWTDWDWPGGEAEFRKAIAFNPNLPEARAFYAHLLTVLGRHDEATAQMQRALELDPLSDLIHALDAVVLIAGRRYDEAIEEANAVLRTAPNQAVALSILTDAYADQGRLPEAFAAERSLFSANNDTAAVAALDRGYARGGYREAMREAAAIAGGRPVPTDAGPLDVATLFIRAGDTSLALEWLERAYAQHDPNLPYISTMPVFDAVRGDPRFQDMLHRMGLPASTGP